MLPWNSSLREEAIEVNPWPDELAWWRYTWQEERITRALVRRLRFGLRIDSRFRSSAILHMTGFGQKLLIPRTELEGNDDAVLRYRQHRVVPANFQ